MLATACTFRFYKFIQIAMSILLWLWDIDHNTRDTEKNTDLTEHLIQETCLLTCIEKKTAIGECMYDQFVTFVTDREWRWFVYISRSSGFANCFVCFIVSMFYVLLTCCYRGSHGRMALYLNVLPFNSLPLTPPCH